MLHNAWFSLYEMPRRGKSIGWGVGEWLPGWAEGSGASPRVMKMPQNHTVVKAAHSATTVFILKTTGLYTLILWCTHCTSI